MKTILRVNSGRSFRSMLLSVAVIVVTMKGQANSERNGGPAATATAFDFSRTVVLGDSLMAGFRHGGLAAPYQEQSITAYIARQAQINIPQPLIAWPGIPNVLHLQSPGFPPSIARIEGQSSGRIDPVQQPMNLSVPAHRVRDALSTRPEYPIDNLTDLVLGLPGLLQGVAKSQVEWAEALKPTTIIAWLGANDVLGAALDGNTNVITPIAQFETDYIELLQRLTETGARVVVANVPDVTVIPYLTSAETFAAIAGLPLEFIGPMLGISRGDYLRPDAFSEVARIMQGQAAPPLHPDLVVSAAEISVTQEATRVYNEIIAEQAAAKGAVLVDMHALLNRWKAEGATYGGRRITADFLGGIFGLDGFHPTAESSLLAANEFIRAMNQAGAELSLIPWMTTRLEAGSLVLRWPEGFGNYRLQVSSTLEPGSWTDLPVIPEIEGSELKVTLPANGAHQFFRLLAE